MPKILTVLPAQTGVTLVYASPRVDPNTGRPLRPQYEHVPAHALAVLANGDVDYLVVSRKDPRELVTTAEDADPLYLGISHTREEPALHEAKFRKLANAAVGYVEPPK